MIRNCTKVPFKSSVKLVLLVIKKCIIFYKNQWHVDTYVVRQFIERPRDYIQSTTIRKPAKIHMNFTYFLFRRFFIFYCIISYLIFLYFFNNIIFVDLWCLFENQINTLLFYVDTKLQPNSQQNFKFKNKQHHVILTHESSCQIRYT